MDLSVTFRMVAIDLDGTSLNSSHEFSERTIETLRRLSRDGIIICISTGRGISSIIKYLEILKLSQAFVPFVSYNGSIGAIYNSATSSIETVIEQLIPEESTRLLLDSASSLGDVVQYYNGYSGDVFAVPLSDEHRNLLSRYAALTGKPQIILSNYEEAISISQSAKLLIMSNNVDRVIDRANVELPRDMFHVIRGSPHPYFVEFLVPNANKGTCLVSICNHLKIPIEHVIAFGDGDNDKEMLSVVGLGCAMKNAQPATKSSAKLVLEWTNDDDGVARKLGEIFYGDKIL